MQHPERAKSPSNKPTQSTYPPNLSSQIKRIEKYPDDQWKELYKEDSESSDPPPVLKEETKGEFLKLRKNNLGQNEQLKKFLKKADEINIQNYRKLETGRPSYPTHDSFAILQKSSKNIIEDIGGDTIYRVKKIYLPEQKKKRVQRKHNSQTKKQSISLKKRLITSTKEVQTQDLAPKSETRYPSGIGRRTSHLKAIQEDQDQEIALEKKRAKKIFNTISLTNQLSKKWQETSRNINKMAKLPPTKYSAKRQHQQRTVFNNTGRYEPRGQSSENRIALNTYTDFWKDQPEKIAQTIQPEKIAQKIQPEIKQSENKLPPPQPPKSKPASSQKNHEQGPSLQSLMVEKNSSSQQVSTVDLFKKQTNFFASKLFVNDFEPGEKQSAQVQFPQVPQLIIGGGKIDPSQIIPQVHPIKLDFNQSDTAWITHTYNPKSSLIKKMDIKTFQIKKYRNGVYFGQLTEESKKEGKGAIFYYNGRLYEGSFVEDMKEGKGYQCYPDGSLYSGNFRKGYKEGKGLFQWHNGEVYDGQWKEGKKHGSGMWKGSEGDSYIGEWKKGKVEGFGVFVDKAGDRYEGEFINFMKHGLGTERYANGDTYVGMFSKNRPNGQGQIYYRNGDYYKGTFSNGLKHGDGMLKDERKGTYKGQFKNDKKCGFGELSTQSGQTYVGNFQNDLRHGYGQIYLQERCNYKGYFVNDKIAEEGMEQKVTRHHPIHKAKTKKNSDMKKKSLSKSPKADKKTSVEGSLSAGPRACGCKRKH